MNIRRRLIVLAAGLALFASDSADPLWKNPRRLQAQQTEAAGQLDRPQWKVGDSWTVETNTQRLQVRETTPTRKPARVRWKFEIAGVEPIAGRECYRIDIVCLAKGRLRPTTTIWCDKETLFLHQFQTQVATNGEYSSLQESYAVPKGAFAAVMAPINALPIALPAFVPSGSKSTGDFSYTSQPAPAGSKDVGLIKFAHKVQQDIGKPSSKALQDFQKAFSKNLEPQTVTEVKLSAPDQQVVQLWQKGAPWPVYMDNGHTQCWLVTE
jgi:hypothetical protein